MVSILSFEVSTTRGKGQHEVSANGCVNQAGIVPVAVGDWCLSVIF